MVLFTSPEDMIIGSTVNLSQRETTSQQAAVELKTTGRLLETAMDYHTHEDCQHKVCKYNNFDGVSVHVGLYYRGWPANTCYGGSLQ